MKKCFALALMCTVCLWMTSQYGDSQASNHTQLPRRTVVDMTGRTVTIPNVINRIVITCYGGATQEISVLSGADKIVGQPSMERFPILLKMYPYLVNAPDAGSFDNINVEHILGLKPDIVVASVYSMQGNKKIEAAGIPVVAITTGRADVNRLLKEFKMMGRVLGEERRADALVRYWNDHILSIRKRTAAIPEARKKKVFYTSSALLLTAEKEIGWGHYFITASGGINVSKNVASEGAVNLEQLLLWNPDVIIVRTNKHTPSPVGSIVANPRFGNIKAVAENAVYPCPASTFWWDRPGPEAILGIIWLAKTLYPEVMRDIDLKRETKSFYRTFYGYNLTDTEYEAFF